MAAWSSLFTCKPVSLIRRRFRIREISYICYLSLGLPQLNLFIIVLHGGSMESEKFKKTMRAQGHWRDGNQTSVEPESYLREDDRGSVTLLQRNTGHWVDGAPSVAEVSRGTGPQSTFSTTDNNESGWYLLIDDSESSAMKLSTELFNEVIEKKSPIIFIVGDGHRKPLFKYAEEIQPVIDAFNAGNLHLYVEFSPKDWLKQSKDKNANILPEIFSEKRKLWPYRKKDIVTPWEPDISTIVSELYDLCVSCSSMISGERKKILSSNRFKFLSNECIKEFSLRSRSLSSSFEAHYNALLETNEDILVETNLVSIISILSGKWRDDYINPYLAEKIAEHASLNPKHYFLVSVGDAHIDWRNSPVQLHLAKIRSMKASFSHIVLFNKYT